ncbi:MAG: helix-turn-helix domain-containing protein [Ktedonobacteraceae bacterium]
MNALNNRDDLDTIPVLPDDVPVTMPTLPTSLVITSFEQFKATSEPVRSRILGIIQNQPATAKQIADRLGATPGAIGHHLHVLEEAGLAQIVARRLVRGIVANYYTRTARIFTYNFPKDVTGSGEAALEIINKAHDERVEAEATIHDDPLRCDSFPHIRLSPERARYYAERLRALVDDVLNETPDPDGKVYGIFVAMFMSPPYMQGSSTTHSSDAV